MSEAPLPSPLLPVPAADRSLRRVLRRLVWLGMLPLGLLACYLAVQTVTHQQQDDQSAAQGMARQVAGTLDQTLSARIDALSL